MKRNAFYTLCGIALVKLSISLLLFNDRFHFSSWALKLFIRCYWCFFAEQISLPDASHFICSEVFSARFWNTSFFRRAFANSAVVEDVDKRLIIESWLTHNLAAPVKSNQACSKLCKCIRLQKSVDYTNPEYCHYASLDKSVYRRQRQYN